MVLSIDRKWDIFDIARGECVQVDHYIDGRLRQYPNAQSVLIGRKGGAYALCARLAGRRRMIFFCADEGSNPRHLKFLFGIFEILILYTDSFPRKGKRGVGGDRER